MSINRKSPSTGSFLLASIKQRRFPPVAIEQRDFAYGHSVLYEAPPKGVFHATMLDQLGEFIAENVLGQSTMPDLIVAHKLTIEGLAVERAAARLRIPYALTVQGNTDRKIIAARPDLKGRFRRIYRNARVAFCFTPVTQRAIVGALGERKNSMRMLPCPTELDEVISPLIGGSGLISVFHLKNHHTKNLDGMVQALEISTKSGVDISLTVFGGGSAADEAEAQKVVGGCSRVIFGGALGRAEVRRKMNEASALVMPSRSESFGLVFIEALFAGLPIIYPAGTAIDGYFDNAEFALRVDPASPHEIRQAMEHAIRHEACMKRKLAEWQQSDAARVFTRPAIARVFADGIRDAVSNQF